MEKPSRKTWQQKLESEGKNPPRLEDLQWEIGPGLRLDPLYDAGSLGSEHAYLADFHAHWASLPRAARPGIRVSVPEKTENHALSEEARNAGIDELYTGFSGPWNLDFPQSYRQGNRPAASSSGRKETDPLLDSLREGVWTPDGNHFLSGTGENSWIHASDVHRAGGGPVAELALALRVADVYASGLGTDKQKSFLSTCTIQLGISPQFWLELAKFRAMRLLWMHFCQSLGHADIPGRIEGETSTVYWSPTDPDSNLIRHSSEVLSALLGGADSLLVHPHSTAAEGVLDAVRQAANQVWLPLKESKLEGIFDPAAGSYLVEIMTHELASAAWARFAEWRKTPIREWVESGMFQAEVAMEAEERKKRFADGKLVMVGANRHPSPLSRPCSPLLVHGPQENSEFPALKPLVLDAR